MIYFSSDFHLGSTLINKYAHRPWLTAHEAAGDIIDFVNETCKPDDILIHCGDFSLQSIDNHGIDKDVPMKRDINEWCWAFLPQLVLLQGNHDEDTSHIVAKNMTIDLSPTWRNVYVSHYPSDHEKYHGPCSIIRSWTSNPTGNQIHFYQEHYSFEDIQAKNIKRPVVALCGHVHDSWLIKFDASKGVLNINVGLDVWGLKPVSSIQLVKLLEFIKTQRVQKLNQSFTWTRSNLERRMDENDRQVKNDRIARKLEKHLKKGLTPEECLRRKQAALAAKKTRVYI